MSAFRALTTELPRGGGAFRLPELTVGVFLVDQDQHRLSVGSDRPALLPLKRQQGWIMPAGAEGLCTYEAPLTVLQVAVPDRIFTEMGIAARHVAPHVGDLAPLLIELAAAAPGFASQPTIFRETMERALAAQIAQSVATVPGPAERIDDPRLRRAVAFIRDRLADDISLEALAAEAAMSPFHFARAFKAATGASPLQYVIRARIETAQMMLRTTRLPVAEIAWRVGYGDVSRFGQHFRRATGATPAAWRNG